MNAGPQATWEGEPVEALAERWGVPSVEAYRRIGSTNDRAMELARAGAGPFTVVLADEQTAGRGRRGAKWQAAPGSALLMSVILPAPVEAPGVVTLLVGLSVAQALERLGAAVGLKWPNDLVAKGGKLGGILCEASGPAAVAGVGINVLGRPGTRQPPPVGGSITLEMLGLKSLSLIALVSETMKGLRCRLPVDTAELDAETLEALRERDALRGRPIDSETLGPCTAVGIEPDGALRVRTRSGAEGRVVAGSVHLR